MIDKQYFSRLAYSYFSGKITAEERKALSKWLSESEENALLFREVEKRYIREKLHDTSLDKEFQNFMENYMPRAQKPPFSRRILNYFVKQRPVFILLFLMVPLLWLYTEFINSRNSTGMDLIECYTSGGEIKTVILPDSSIITLNEGSVLLYPSSFDNSKREIYLTGEAYLEVKKEENRPFLVRINELDIKVLGTSFNVSSYPGDSLNTITLIEGAVDVFLKSGEGNYLLNPDEKLSYNKQTGKVSQEKIVASRSILWTDGSILIESLTLKEIIPLLERRFNKKFYLRDAISNSARLTVRFTSGESLEYILEVIQKLLPGIHYEIEEDIIFFL